MAEQIGIHIFVKIEFWDAYRASVLVTARQFRKLLFIFGIMGGLMFALFAFALTHPMPRKDWYETLNNAKPLVWVFGLPILFVFLLPLLAAQKMAADERIKKGIRYRFSDSGIHVESSVATTDLLWAAIREVIETRSAFLLFPNANLAHIIPLRCFESTAEVVALRELLRANVPQIKLSRQ
jgi:hypothetical protein